MVTSQVEQLFKPLDNQMVECNVCYRRCAIKPSESGFCGGYKNQGGTIVDLTYGRPTTTQITELGWAPVINFANPADQILSVGSRGCSDRCNHCINYTHAFQKHEGEMGQTGVSPAEIVDYALATGCKGIAGNFNESLLALAYWRDIYSLAKKCDLYTVAVTNGGSTPEAIDCVADYLDVFRCDIKAKRADTARRQGNLINPAKVLETLKHVRNTHPKVHIELVTMVHQGINDDPEEFDEIAKWIADELGLETPWSLSPMHPVKMSKQLPPEYIQGGELVKPNGSVAGQKINFQNDGYVLKIGYVNPQLFPPLKSDPSTLANLDKLRQIATSHGLYNVHVKSDGR